MMRGPPPTAAAPGGCVGELVPPSIVTQRGRPPSPRGRQRAPPPFRGRDANPIGTAPPKWRRAPAGPDPALTPTPPGRPRKGLTVLLQPTGPSSRRSELECPTGAARLNLVVRPSRPPHEPTAPDIDPPSTSPVRPGTGNEVGRTTEGEDP